MAEERKDQADSININFNNSSVNAGQDINIKGRESKTTTVGDMHNGSTLISGDNSSVRMSQSYAEMTDLKSILASWKAEMISRIEAQPSFDDSDKEDLKEIITKIENEATKADKANPGRIEKLLNTIAVMGPDIFQVAITTLASPLQGIGLVLKKISDKVKVELQKKST